jgi:uncharacterized protein (TIGR02284 family)
MERDEIIEKLNDLIKLDIDASNAYMEAVEHIDDVEIAEQLMSFREEHEAHIDGLCEQLSLMGEPPPERKQDFKGYLIEGFTSLRSVTGTGGALEAMQGNEKMTNRNYKEATDWDMPDDIKDKIDSYYEDEKKHLEYISMKLEELHHHAHHR